MPENDAAKNIPLDPSSKGDYSSRSPKNGDMQPPASKGCGCGASGCGAGLPRREFLKMAGAGFVATSFGRGLLPMAGPFGAVDMDHGHLVPADKKLNEAWVRSLFKRGVKEVWTGKSLANIGMPCGGIGAGQLYLCGDGTLGSWQIFNNAASNWVDGTNATYQHRGIPKPVDQGFAVAWRTGDTASWAALSAEGFDSVEFQGEYPIGQVRYRGADKPIAVTMEAFSPFIPLNAADSTLPATVFNITVKNTASGPLKASLAGWLQNYVSYAYGAEFDAQRRTRVTVENGRVFVLHSAEMKLKSTADEAQAVRPPIVFADFERQDYAGWRVGGTAFGPGPAKGTLPGQNTVSGFQGDRLVNTFFDGDDTKGTLTSSSFTVSRKYINFLLGGGGFAGETCMNLVVDGQLKRTATGKNDEKLLWYSWAVADLEGKEAQLVIVDSRSGGWGHVNVDQIEFSDERRTDGPGALEDAPDFGTMALACLTPGNGPGEPYTGRPVEQLVTEPDVAFAVSDTRLGYLTTGEVELTAGAEHTFTFCIAWHFPNQKNGHSYAARFEDALAVARYVLGEHGRLTADTRLWRDTYYDSTLPYWLLDRLHSTVSTLATGTCQYWKNGRFWAWEGVNCCEGTCTHVWNYAHAEARLFPELARSTRELQDFNPRENGGGFHPDTGLVGFRSNDSYAADGQCGTILKAYREHLMSKDNAFLERNWPKIKKALEFSIEQDAKGPTDGSPSPADGLIENTQHNTYDINYEGANTFVGSLYLAALRAGEEMARVVGDTEFAQRARAIFESGSAKTMERLWNGEYFIQDVDLEKYPKHQYKDGCLSDQLFGQGWACLLKLGDIYPVESVRTALQNVWKYNWAPDIAAYNEAHPPFRWFISPGQAGLFTCTWPKSEHLKEGTLYREEVWTGIEYQVAGHMIWENMLLEGLAVCRAVHDRYHPDLFNPYNEVECGDHYARALASWGVYLALCGFEYDGPRGHIGFDPRLTPENFRAAFTAAAGWGVFEQQRTGAGLNAQLVVKWGELPIRSLRLATGVVAGSPRVVAGSPRVVAGSPRVVAGSPRVVAGSPDPATLPAEGLPDTQWLSPIFPKHIVVTLDGKTIDAGVDIEAGTVLLTMRESVVLQPGQVIAVGISALSPDFCKKQQEVSCGDIHKLLG